MTSAYAVSVTKNGEPVNFTPVFIDREESPTQEGIFYGRVLELSGTFSGEGYAVSVSTEAENYAGKRLESAYESASLGVAQLVGSLSHAYPNRFVTDVGDTENLVVVVRDTEGKPMPNAPVTVTEETGGTLSFESRTVVSNAEGRAVFTVTGISSGSDVLTFTADSAGIAMNTRVTSLGTESPKKPTANLTDG
ncbi:MAG: Ig-like domain-containing protein, partial [Oscillospiraceae bacterium]|nr:Ig-like domain-containing protein [Oscillospiraceae bacterium]